MRPERVKYLKQSISPVSKQRKRTELSRYRQSVYDEHTLPTIGDAVYASQVQLRDAGEERLGSEPSVNRLIRARQTILGCSTTTNAQATKKKSPPAIDQLLHDSQASIPHTQVQSPSKLGKTSTKSRPEDGPFGMFLKHGEQITDSRNLDPSLHANAVERDTSITQQQRASLR